jgi:hypothetical protein
MVHHFATLSPVAAVAAACTRSCWHCETAAQRVFACSTCTLHYQRAAARPDAHTAVPAQGEKGSSQQSGKGAHKDTASLAALFRRIKQQEG